MSECQPDASALATCTISPSPAASTSHLPRTSTSTRKHGTRDSLGLIDAARVRLAKDFHSLVRASAKSKRNRNVSSPQTDESEDERTIPPDYDSNWSSSHLTALDDEPMEHSSEERTGRSLGTRIVNFLSRSRSRSRSKKRRSRSLDDIVVHDPMPSQGVSKPFHSRNSSSEKDDSSGASNATPKARTRIASRPLSSTTTATNSTVKPKKIRPPERAISPLPMLQMHAEAVVLQRTPSTSSHKGKKKNIFGFSLSNPRKASFSSEKSKSRPSTPGPGSSGLHSVDNGKERGLWGGRSAPGSQRSQHDTHKYPTLHGDPNAMRLLTESRLDNSRTTRPNVVAAQRPAPIRLLNGELEDEPEIGLNDLGGRCSPLCGLGPSKAASSSTDKGKGREVEKARSSKERTRSHQLSRTEKESEDSRYRDHDRITHPRRVGSPIQRDREARSKISPSPLPVQKVASGSGSSSKGALSPAAAATAARMKRIKHGSFDFERPVSTSAVGGGHGPIRPAVRHNSSDKEVVPRIGSPHPMDGTHGAGSRPGVELRSKSPTPPIPAGRQRPVLDVSTTIPALSRRATGSSTASARPHALPAPYSRMHNNSNNNNSETDPASPTSSHSNSSAPNGSWGRNGGKRITRGSHGPFKFEPAVPPIPGSPATDRRKGVFDSDYQPPRTFPSRGVPSSPLSQSAQARQVGKGRSLDLGLGLSWAPSKVREEAVMHRPSMSTNGNGRAKPRARWRDGAGVDEEGRLGGAVVGSAASDVADAFREALGDAAYTTFKNYVHRFDAHAIPLDGPFGLLQHVCRLLDSAPGLDDRRKQRLLDRFVRVVQENR